uniref:PiggyBac transposable element-derived protein domain-containing protein n=1 Tax=Anopheles funestus TaxID=62324 RepID=A0A182RWV0_ANOFN
RLNKWIDTNPDEIKQMLGLMIWMGLVPLGRLDSYWSENSKSETGDRQCGLAQDVCMELSNLILNEGRTMYIDNFYTSYELATYFLANRTHVVGTLRANKKNIPRCVLNAKLKRGEIISRENNEGVVVLKWKDIRDLRILSTKHAPSLVSVNKTHLRRSTKRQHKRALQKPEAVLEYNRAKCGIDLSDQMGAYATTLRKGVKWYRKLAIELLLGTSVVNAWVIYKAATKQKIQIRKFRELLVQQLL